MVRKGEKVQILTKKVGTSPRVGVVVSRDGELVTVEWEDGRTSTVSASTVVSAAKTRSNATRS